MTQILKLTPFTYPDLTEPNGHLSRDMRAQACWYFYTLAQKVRELHATQQGLILEDELWMDKRYIPLAKAVAMQYGLASPDEFAKAWDEVRAQAVDMGLPLPHPEYTRLAPGIIANGSLH